MTYLENEPGEVVRSYRVLAQAIHSENFGGDALDDVVALAGIWQFQNLWSLAVVGNYAFETLDDRAARGGPAIRDAAASIVDVQLSTDPRKALMGSASLRYIGKTDGGATRSLGLTATIRPAPWWRIELGPRFSRTGIAGLTAGVLGVFVAAAEELLRRGFLLTEMAAIFGHQRGAWAAAAGFLALAQTVAHAPAGLSHALAAGMADLVLAAAYLGAGRSLWGPLLARAATAV